VQDLLPEKKKNMKKNLEFLGISFALEKIREFGILLRLRKLKKFFL